MMCVLIFSATLCETFLILRRIQRDKIINVYCSSCKVSVILVRFGQKLDFLHSFSQNTHISIFMKIRLVVAELFDEDGRTGGQT